MLFQNHDPESWHNIYIYICNASFPGRDFASTFSSTYFKNGIVLCCSQAHKKPFQKPGWLLLANQEPEQMSGDHVSTQSHFSTQDLGPEDNNGHSGPRS